jgi:DNA-binding MarR family transcriptional regulator
MGLAWGRGGAIISFMKQFHDETIDVDARLADTAQLTIDAGVRLTRFVRRAIRLSPPAELSLTRLRALAWVAENPGVSVSELAETLLVGVPTGSKLVDDLVGLGLITRTSDEADRRRVSLRVTDEGERTLAQAKRPAQREIARLLSQLSAAERRRLREGLQILAGLLQRPSADASDA